MPSRCAPSCAPSSTPSVPAARRLSPAKRASPVSKSPSAASTPAPSCRARRHARDREESLAETDLAMNQHSRLDARPIPFIDVAAQRRRLGRAIDDAVARVLAHCQFILGPEVRALEAELAAFCGARHAITCSSGTDALRLVLMAWGIGPGDAVICPAFTFCATAEVVALCGATPVMADVSTETFNLDPASCERAVATAKRLGLKPRAVIPVDLFGLPADHDAIGAVAAKYDLLVLDDAAQAFGATYRGRKLGAIGPATATSFFPAKPLGCYGDGGAIFTDNDDLAARLKS